MTEPPLVTPPTPFRSALMQKVRQRDTKPEVVVRRVAHALGYRFRLHRRDLPGSPDIVLPRHKVAVFVHGCFWHRHPGCRLASTPATNTAFWTAKFERNMERDLRKERELRSLGWRVMVIWECETSNPERLAKSLKEFVSLSRSDVPAAGT